MKPMLELLTALLLCLLWISQPARAAELIASGGWSSLVIGYGGQGRESTYTSDPGVAFLSVIDVPTQQSWRIEVRLGDPASLPQDCTLWIRRTGKGSGDGWVRGGSGFQLLDPGPRLFIEGAGTMMNIPLQFRIKGITSQTPSGTYSPEVVYSLEVF